MTVKEAIAARRSIRKYRERDTPIPQEHLDLLLEAAMRAPSACDTRPWSLIVVQSREKLDALADAHPHGKMVRDCPAAIVIAALPQVQSGLSDGFFPQDCAAAAQNILLQAAELGLGTCWCGVYPKEETMKNIRETLGGALAPGAIPFNLIAIGHPAEDFGSRGSYDKKRALYL
ncbi:MAG: nitroreductase family protein [Treponema sp.]|nr:nitroreductase family protein [Treponema sp.]